MPLAYCQPFLSFARVAEHKTVSSVFRLHPQFPFIDRINAELFAADLNRSSTVSVFTVLVPRQKSIRVETNISFLQNVSPTAQLFAEACGVSSWKFYEDE